MWKSSCEKSQETEVLPWSVAGTVKVVGPSTIQYMYCRITPSKAGNSAKSRTVIILGLSW